MSKEFYFVRESEDKKFRIYRCYVRLNKECAIIKVNGCKHKFGQNDGVFRGDSTFIINFQVPNGYLILEHSVFSIAGITYSMEDNTYFQEGCSIYFEKNMIPNYKDMEMGN